MTPHEKYWNETPTKTRAMRAEYYKYEIFGSMTHAVNWARRGGRANKKLNKKVNKRVSKRVNKRVN